LSLPVRVLREGMPNLRDNQAMDQGDTIKAGENPVIRKVLSLEEKLRLIDEMRGCTAGLPSGTDMLLEDRRRERERELAEEGW
jgi:hypothetical protein